MAGGSVVAYLHLLESGQYSDLIIDCQGYEFKVHRAIVCTASPMLNKACGGSFTEATEGRINLSEDDPEILARVILYLYTGLYKAEKLPDYFAQMLQNTEGQTAPATHSARAKNTDVPFNVLNTHTLIYKTADMLGIDKLKSESAFCFLEKARGLLDCDSFAEPLEIMFNSTHESDADMRLRILTLCAEKYATIVKHQPVVDVILRYERNAWLVTKSILEDSKRKKVALEEALSKVMDDRCPCAECGDAIILDGSTEFTVYDTLDVRVWCDSSCLSRADEDLEV